MFFSMNLQEGAADAVTQWLRRGDVGGAVATPPLLKLNTVAMVRSILAFKGYGGRTLLRLTMGSLRRRSRC